ncbi:molecular chaperone DnaJ [Synergistales bacterium]|nr:molecular chaperone DnaJ [Synergistales bacterium]
MSVNGNANFKALGLTSDASWGEIKSAFRRLARTYHPDVAGPEGARKFAEITEAYMILKETVSRSGSAGARAAAAPKESAAASTTVTSAVVTTDGKRDSIFKKIWKKLFVSKNEAQEDDALDEDIPPARLRFIGSVISRAEADMRLLIERRGTILARNRTEAVLRRLRSKHSGVILLALQSLSARNVTDEMRRAVLEHFTDNIPTSDVLENLLSIFASSPRASDLARLLTARAHEFTASDAIMILKWFKRLSASKECFAAFLSHEAPQVLAAALNMWPAGYSLSDSADVGGILDHHGEETVLVPLLGILKRERVSQLLMPRLTRIMGEHPSPAVRVWASAIVRERNMG